MKYHAYNDDCEHVGEVYLGDDASDQEIVNACADGKLYESDSATLSVEEFEVNEESSAVGYLLLDEDDEELLMLYPDGHEPPDFQDHADMDLESRIEDAEDDE